MDFTAVPETLRASGSTAATAVQALRGANCWAPAEGMSAAMPGAGAGVAAHSYSDSWTFYFTGWCTTAEQHAKALTDSAQAYAVTEAHTASAIAGLAPGTGGNFSPVFNDVTEALGG